MGKYYLEISAQSLRSQISAGPIYIFPHVCIWWNFTRAQEDESKNHNNLVRIKTCRGGVKHIEGRNMEYNIIRQNPPN